MTRPQQETAPWVSMFFLAIPVGLFVWLAIYSLQAEPLGDRFPGSFAMAVAADGAGAAANLKWLPVIIAAGFSLIIPKDRADWRFIVTVVMAIVGILATLYFYFALNGGEMAHRFWSYTDVPGMDSPDAIESNLRPMFLSFAGWLGGILGIQLGINFWPNSGGGGVAP